MVSVCVCVFMNLLQRGRREEGNFDILAAGLPLYITGEALEPSSVNMATDVPLIMSSIFRQVIIIRLVAQNWSKLNKGKRDQIAH